jgi:hypothetical protein
MEAKGRRPRSRRRSSNRTRAQVPGLPGVLLERDDLLRIANRLALGLGALGPRSGTGGGALTFLRSAIRSRAGAFADSLVERWVISQNGSAHFRVSHVVLDFRKLPQLLSAPLKF